MQKTIVVQTRDHCEKMGRQKLPEDTAGFRWYVLSRPAWQVAAKHTTLKIR